MSGAYVKHKDFGRCTIVFESNNSVIIRTADNSIHECLKSDLNYNTFEETFPLSIETLLRVQGALIDSINTAWGLFSQTAIHLLPHQLWVCNQTMKQWPTRMLVADDVGLGKTVEAGIILTSAISSGRAKRVLILTPASLTHQWQKRMKVQFDLNFEVYYQEQERNNEFYWDVQDRVIASISTLRLDNHGRHEKLLSAKPWDIVLVDEAHHIGSSNGDFTLGYNLFHKLDENEKIKSAIFFTATPHQGKDDDFWSLMELLDPVSFKKELSLTDRNKNLREHMIRNKKDSVIDMNGNKLFKGIKTYSEDFTYSPEEREFYAKMTQYIQEGFAYSSNLSDKVKQQVQLVLTSLQKIASSSVAAIKGAFKKRKATLLKTKKSYSFDYQNIEGDDIDPTKANFFLMKDEVKHIDELLAIAEKVKYESRIKGIINLIKRDFPSENILLFTEYKETQSIMVDVLRHSFGSASTFFINGDDKLKFSNGREETCIRKDIMERFNRGQFRFLVSTEASSEGVDLQSSCHVLIHIDLPWNPMRMQQRVGRIYRYMQKEDVVVAYLKNEETIESKIYSLLQEKLKNVMSVFSNVQDQSEDLLSLVIGIGDDSFYRNLYKKANQQPIQTLDKWFDNETKTFGSVDALSAIMSITGNAASFDLSFLDSVPRLDIHDIKPFFESMLEYNGKRLRKDGDELFRFNTPDKWRITSSGKKEIFIGSEYSGVAFSREIRDVSKIIGVGSQILNKALKQANSFEGVYALIDSLSSYYIVRVYERITTSDTLVKSTFMGYEIKDGEICSELDDYKLFRLIESIISNKKYITEEKQVEINNDLEKEVLSRAIKDYRHPGIEFTLPDSELFACLIGKKEIVGDEGTDRVYC